MSTAEVGQWVVHAVQLPQYADVFVANSITGYDFPALLENDGQSLLEDLAVGNNLHRRQIMRAIQMRLLGVGGTPDAPIKAHATAADCSTIRIDWVPPPDNGVIIHKYLVQVRECCVVLGRTQSRKLSACDRCPFSYLFCLFIAHSSTF